MYLGKNPGVTEFIPNLLSRGLEALRPTNIQHYKGRLTGPLFDEPVGITRPEQVSGSIPRRREE
jgi:hypothetical protein